MQGYWPSKRLLVILTLICSALIASTYYKRFITFDDAWFAEQSYFFAKDGIVRSELFRGHLMWHERLYVFHKLYVYAGGLFFKIMGFGPYIFKSVSLCFFLVYLGLVWVHFKKHQKPQIGLLAIYIALASGLFTDLSFSGRPELLQVAVGFFSFMTLCQQSGTTRSYANTFLSGFFAAMAALTHLNGVVYMAAGASFLLVKREYKHAIFFSSVSGLALIGLYFGDALINNQLELMLYQLRYERAIVGSRSFISQIQNILSAHQIFFHNPPHITLSTITLGIVIYCWKNLWNKHRDLMLYTCLLLLWFALTINRITRYYYMMFAPFFILITAYTAHEWIEHNKIKLAKIIGAMLLSTGVYVTINLHIRNHTEHDIMMENQKILSHLTQKNVNVLAPLTFIFSGIEDYRIKGLNDYIHINPATKQPWTPTTLFENAHELDLEYLIFQKHPYFAYYQLPDDIPEEFENYKQIYRDNQFRIFAR